MDYQQFYLSAQGRVNRKQWWLYLILPVFVVSLILSVVDGAIGTIDTESGLGLLSGIWTLIILIPSILVHIKRPRQVRLVGADRSHSHHRRSVAVDRTRIPQGDGGTEPVRTAGYRVGFRHRVRERKEGPCRRLPGA